MLTHHPNRSITTTPHALTRGDSEIISTAKSFREEGTNTSSCSMLHVFEWWFLCEMRHEWYGTSSALCSTQPTVSLTHLELEKAWWPHSCASTHTPVIKVPCTHQYSGHSAHCAAGGAPRMRVAAKPSAAIATTSRST